MTKTKTDTIEQSPPQWAVEAGKELSCHPPKPTEVGTNALAESYARIIAQYAPKPSGSSLTLKDALDVGKHIAGLEKKLKPSGSIRKRAERAAEKIEERNDGSISYSIGDQLRRREWADIIAAEFAGLFADLQKQDYLGRELADAVMLGDTTDKALEDLARCYLQLAGKEKK